MVLLVHTFFSHFHFFKVAEIMLKYGDLMLPAWYIAFNIVFHYSTLPPFVKLYKALFDAKHLEKGLNSRGQIFGALFSKESALFHKKYPFLLKVFFFS